jgi:hypothetical protein
MNTCDPKQKWTTDDCWEQQWPQLVVQNITFKNAYSAVRQTSTSSYGGGAIFDEGGQLKVVNSAFLDDRCYSYGPDLGGGAIRAVGMYMRSPNYITHDTFTGNSCSNGAALSGLYANFDVINSLLTGNKAIGWGANPASPAWHAGGRQRRRDLHRRRPLQPRHRRHGRERQQRTRRRRRHLLRGRRRRRDPADRVLHAAPQLQRGIPERARHFDSVNGRVTAPVVIHSTIS